MALPPDIAALLGGGGAPPDPSAGAGGPIPSDMMAALGGMPQGGDPNEMEPPGPDESPEGALHSGNVAPGDPEEAYRTALDALEMGMKSDNDDARIQTMMQCATKIQGELSKSQTGQDAALGGKFDPSQMRRMSAAGQAY